MYHLIKKKKNEWEILQNNNNNIKMDGIVRLTDLDVSRCQLPTRAKVDSDELPL